MLGVTVDGRHVQTYQSSGTSLQKCQLPVPHSVKINTLQEHDVAQRNLLNSIR